MKGTRFTAVSKNKNVGFLAHLGTLTYFYFCFENVKFCVKKTFIVVSFVAFLYLPTLFGFKMFAG